MTDLSTLIKKLRGLKGPDREVDAEIHRLLVGEVFSFPLSGSHSESGLPVVPGYTATIDAAVKLIEREMPYGYDIWARHRQTVAMVYWSEDDGTKATAYTPAIALLLAFLTAKMEMKGG